jgi:hypothetical protein
MNWYIISQIGERRKWEKFPPNRQREFPFMHEPGYERKAKPFLGEEAPTEYDFDYNLYHVTTNLQGVVGSGRLKSRLELGGVVGLGGGLVNEAPHLISVTYSYGKAAQIYDDLKFVCEIVSGKVQAHTIFNSFDFDEMESGFLESVMLEWINRKIIKKYLNGEMSEQEFELLLDREITDSERIYSFWKDLEEAKIESMLEVFENSADIIDLGVTGFTGSFEDMKKINPSQIAILQIIARKNSQPEHIPTELELRFRPADLRVVKYLKP